MAVVVQKRIYSFEQEAYSKITLTTPWPHIHAFNNAAFFFMTITLTTKCYLIAVQPIHMYTHASLYNLMLEHVVKPKTSVRVFKLTVKFE